MVPEEGREGERERERERAIARSTSVAQPGARTTLWSRAVTVMLYLVNRRCAVTSVHVACVCGTRGVLGVCPSIGSPGGCCAARRFSLYGFSALSSRRPRQRHRPLIDARRVIARLEVMSPQCSGAHDSKGAATCSFLKGVDAGLNKIEGRDPLRHRRSRASPLRRLHDRGSCACSRLCPE